MSEALVEGAKAPAFDMPAAGGGRVRLEDHAGRPLVLYFYPKADTPGCTTEAIDFTAALPGLRNAGATVIGVSKDPVGKLEKFRAKHELGIALASDESTDVAERYGVWGEKKMYGKTYMGIDRSTFLIDGEGILRRIWRGVKVKGHADDVVAAVRALGAG